MEYTKEILKEFRQAQAKKMRYFSEMLDYVKDRYGDCYPMVLNDFAGISLLQAESLSFTPKQFKSVEYLCTTPLHIVAHAYSD